MSNQTPATKCPRCGAARSAEFRFCPHCGASFDAHAKIKSNGRKKETAQRRRWEIAAIAGIIILVVVVFNIYISARKHSEPVQTGAPQQQMPPQNQPMPTTFDGIVQRAHELYDARQFGQAIQFYERALAIDSLHPEIMVDLGAAYHFVGDNEAAALNFHRALALDPKQPVAMFNLGIVALTVGDSAAAKSWWNKLIQEAPTSQQAAMARERLQAVK